MLGRKAAIVAALVVGAALAGPSAAKAPLHRSVVVRHTAANVHFPCRHGGERSGL
jgi:hypothetical protein